VDIHVGALYVSALVWFHTFADVVVVAIVLDVAASSVYTIATKPNVADD